MRKRFSAAMVSSFVLLGACGGGGNGVGTTPAPPPVPTPTPTPTPIATNTSLIAPLVSESFTNDAAVVTGSFYADARVCPNCTASRTGLTVQYDAGNSGYTVATGARRSTFLPANRDAAQSSPVLTVYQKTSGPLTESLSLTVPGGAAGILNYSHVGAGFWQRATALGDHVDFSFDAFTYGVETPDVALPRTGSASYDVDLIGAMAWGGPVSLVGEGQLSANFATGEILTLGTLSEVYNGGGSIGLGRSFLGRGTISSSSNMFDGTFRFNAPAGMTLNGSMNGRFYGPASEEVGAVFTAATGTGVTATGTITGKKGDGATNASFDALTTAQSFANDAAFAKMTFTPSGIAGQSAGSEALIVYYDPNVGGYTVIGADRLFEPDGIGFVVQPAGGWKYVRGATWTIDSSVSGYTIAGMAYGMETAASAMPRIGDAHYVVQLSGALSDPSEPQRKPIALGGAGVLIANFASGSLEYSGTTIAGYAPFSGRPPSVEGSFSGTGAITSGNRFSGSFDVDLLSLGLYAGRIDGRFYGPDGQEVGGAVYGTDAASNVLTASLWGGQTAAVNDSTTPIASLTHLNRLSQQPSFVHYYYTLGENEFRLTNDFADDLHISYSHGDATERMRYQTSSGTPIVSFGAAERDVAGSTPVTDVYRRTIGSKEYETRVYNLGADGAPIALTYASYATLIIRTPSDPTAPFPSVDVDLYNFLIGSPTTGALAPRTGTGSYSGVVSGRGLLGNSTQAYTLSGASALNVDFGASTGRLTLDIQGRNDGSGTVRDFGSIPWDVRLDGGNPNASFKFYGVPATGQDSLHGFFFGPRAEEFGANFRTTKDGVLLVGTTVGKRN